jgi:mono/diheme cytochrome c family protein
MFTHKSMGLVLAGILLAGSATILVGWGAEASREPQQKTMEKAPITHSNPASGQQMYKDYCAACHGASGKGDGPAVGFLKAPLPDLTTMAKRNDGKFPAEHFIAVLRFGTEGHPHGTSDMPIWGPLFRTQNKDVTELRISNLTSYVESIQQK